MARSTAPGTPRGLQPPDKKPVRITVPEGQKVRYGDPFFPKVPFQAIFYIAAIFGVLVFLALVSPAPLEDPADPLNHAAIDPKPEWYFMFLFQLLKYFPGNFIVIGTVVIPGIVTTLLILLPFYDRNWARHISRRPAALASMSGGMLIVIFLTWGGFGFPTPSFNTTSGVASTPVGNNSGPSSTTDAISPQVAAIFSAHCSACHLNGQALGGLNLSNYAGLIKGGNVVPGAVIQPGHHETSILWKIIQPKGPWPGGSRMPLGGPYLSAGDEKTIADWIDGLGKQESGGVPGANGQAGPQGGGNSAGAAPVSFKKDIEGLFSAHCAACHLNGQAFGGLNLGSYQGLVKGGQIVPGPVFKAGDHAHSVIWEITQPKGPWPGSTRMPLGGPYLSAAEEQKLAAWMNQGAKDN